MGTSTDGLIFYGACLGEDGEVPWSEYDDINEWWAEEVCGYKPSVEIFDADGDYLNGVEPTDEQLDTYFDERAAFDKTHPLPVELVNYCSIEYPLYALIVPGCELRCARGAPVEFEPWELTVEQEKVDALLAFCKEYGIEIDQPKWFLASYWG